MNNHLKTSLKIVVLLVVFSPPVCAQVSNHSFFYLTDKRAPLTELEIVFLGAGKNQDDFSPTGLAITTARLVEDYSKKHGYTARLEALGTGLNFYTYSDYQVISISTLSTNLEVSAKIVSDLKHRMAVTDSAIEEAKRKLQVSYEKTQQAGEHRLLRNYVLARTLGVRRWFSREAMKQITLEDVRKNCAGFLNADFVFFKAISDLDSVTVVKALRPMTEDRQKGGFGWLPAPRRNNRLPGHSASVFEHYSHLKNVYAYWLVPIGTVGEDNHVPHMVTSALGRGGSRGLLLEYLREELGLVYGTSCTFRREDDVRFLEIYADPRLENSEELMTKMHEFIAGLADNPDFWSSIGELRENPDANDAHMHGELTPRRKLDRAVDRAIYNFPSREGGIKSVTDAEIRSFLRNYFVAQNLVMMLFGPKDHIIGILEKHWPEVEIHVLTTESTNE